MRHVDKPAKIRLEQSVVMELSQVRWERRSRYDNFFHL